MSGQLSLALKLNINCCLKVFRNPHKNWDRNYEIRVWFELTFSAIIIDSDYC